MENFSQKQEGESQWLPISDLMSVLMMIFLLIAVSYMLKVTIEKEKIEEINKLKLKLFTNISHDFRTPLTLIIGPLERMLKNKDGNIHVQKQILVFIRCNPCLI